MRKILCWCGLLLSIAIGVGSYYFWNQLTQLPAEYTEGTGGEPESDLNSPQVVQKIQQQAAATQEKITTQIQQSDVDKPVKVTISDRDLNHLVVKQLSTKSTAGKIPTGIKTVDTKIVDGKLQAVAVVNIGELLESDRGQENAQALNKLADRLPFIKDRDIYVSMVGKPIAKDGKIKFDRDTQIKVGNLSLTIAELAQNLGVSEDKLDRLVNLQLEQQKMQIESLELDGDKMKIAGKRKQ
jgi:hypothetical protein